MKTFKVQLSSVADIKRFVNSTAGRDFDISILRGNSIVDAKSIMDMFSADLTRPVLVESHGSDDENESFYQAVLDFVVE